MKILIDARLYGLEHTGIGRYLVNLIEQLINLQPDEEFILLLKEKYFNEIKLPKRWTKIKANFRQYTFEEQIKLPVLIKNLKPDVVHFPHFNIPIFWRGKFVVTIHDMSMHYQGINATKLPLPVYLFKRIPYKYTFRQAVVTSSAVITPTFAVKNEIVDYFGIDENKVEAIYEGLEEKRFESRKSGVLKKYGLDGKYFFYVGDVYPHKNIKSAIDAVKLLSEKGVKVTFAIACSRGFFIDALKRHAKETGVLNQIKFLGFVPDSDLSSLLNHSNGLVYPSFAEGFGLQGLEAIASGTIVLASDIPVFKEIYGNSAFYFDPRNVSSIASAMKYVLDLDVGKKEKLIQNSKKLINKYSWEKMAQETFEIYYKVLEK